MPALLPRSAHRYQSSAEICSYPLCGPSTALLQMQTSKCPSGTGGPLHVALPVGSSKLSLQWTDCYSSLYSESCIASMPRTCVEARGSIVLVCACRPMLLQQRRLLLGSMALAGFMRGGSVGAQAAPAACCAGACETGDSSCRPC